MGFDPLVATICASSGKKDLPITFAQDSLQVCPTSYVTRICNEDIVLNGTLFTKGSIVTLSLLPTKNEKNNITENSLATKSLSFGLGNHICIGKKNSFVILNMAERVWAEVKKNIPIENVTIAPEGAFLAYKIW
jgi:cytochrome P450